MTSSLLAVCDEETKSNEEQVSGKGGEGVAGQSDNDVWQVGT